MQWLNKQNPSNYKGAELDLILIWNTAGQELVTPSYLVRYFTAQFPSLLSCPLRVLSYKGLLHIRRDVFENSCGSRRSFLNLLMINCCHLSRFFLKDEKIWSLNQVNRCLQSSSQLQIKATSAAWSCILGNADFRSDKEEECTPTANHGQFQPGCFSFPP